MITPMPDPLPSAECCQGWTGPLRPCVCDEDERVLRGWASEMGMRAMTPQQREWCVEEIEGCGDSTYQPGRIVLFAMSQKDLASAVLHAWRDYARDKGLL
jgi:hypothetical protein